MVGTASPCPGCGVILEATDWPFERRANASPTCWHLYTEVLNYEMEHLTRLGRFHQVTVDAYDAQHAGEPSPPISTAFGLIALYLAFEHRWPGTAVQAAHQFLAKRYSMQPSFRSRTDRAVPSFADVAAATTPEHPHVGAWADEALPQEVPDRLRRACTRQGPGGGSATGLESPADSTVP